MVRPNPGLKQSENQIRNGTHSQTPESLKLKNPHGQEAIGEVAAAYDGVMAFEQRINTFRNIDRLFPTRIVANGECSSPLQVAPQTMTMKNFVFGDKTYDLDGYIAANCKAGLLVLKDGEVAYESYHHGNGVNTRWMSMSVAKSVTAILMGIALQDGYIASLDERVTDYVPELTGSAYDRVTLRQVLHMASGVSWDETYTNSSSDRRRLLQAQCSQQPGAMLGVMAGLKQVAEPGSVWNYSTGETQIAAAIVQAATGQNLAEYLSLKLWQPLGMESAATWWLESDDGVEVGGSGIAATLRDFGRLGLFLLDDGMIGDQRVLPEGWIQEASCPQQLAGQRVDYGYMFWTMPDYAGPIHQGAFAAIGIFGQLIYINPAEHLVVVAQGVQQQPKDEEATLLDLVFCGAVAENFHR